MPYTLFFVTPPDACSSSTFYGLLCHTYFPLFLSLAAYGSSFKLIVCHEIGHAIGVNDSYDKRTIMHYNAGFTEAADDVLDWDSRNAVRWLYYIPYPSTATSQTTSTASKTNSKTTSSIKPPTTTTSSPTTPTGTKSIFPLMI